MVRGTQLTTKLKDLLVKYPHYLTNWHNLYTYIYVLCTLHATDFETSRHNKYITTSVWVVVLDMASYVKKNILMKKPGNPSAWV
jgi:hypothetical protein